MSDYKTQLWHEIAVNDPPTAKFIRDMHTNFQSRLWTFRWLREPKHLFCVWVKRRD